MTNLETRFVIAASSQGGAAGVDAAIGDVLAGETGASGYVLTKNPDGSVAFQSPSSGGVVIAAAPGVSVVTRSGTAYVGMSGYFIMPPVYGASDSPSIYQQTGTAYGTGNTGGFETKTGDAQGGGNAGVILNVGGTSNSWGNAGAIGNFGGAAEGTGRGGYTYNEAGRGNYGPGGISTAIAGSSAYSSGNYLLISGGFTGNGLRGPVLTGQSDVGGSPFVTAATVSWGVAENPNGKIFYTAMRPERVTGIVARVGAATGATATATVVKVASGDSPSDGTALTSDSVNANGTTNTNQTLALEANVPGTTTLTLLDTPSDGSTVSFGSLTFTFNATVNAAVANSIHIGGSIANALTNLANAISGGGTPGTDYSELTKPYTDFLNPGSPSAGSLVVAYAAIAASANNNSVTTTTTVTGGSFTGGVMAGGSAICDLAVGDSLALTTTGTWTSGTGAITVHMTWI